MSRNAPPLLVAYGATNVVLVIIGYEAALTHVVPHGLLLLLAFVVAIVAAMMWSRVLGRSYAREDRAHALAEHLLTRPEEK